MAKPVEVTIEDELKKLIAENLGVDIKRVTSAARFTYDLGADSLDLVELCYCVEERFHIEINQDKWIECALTLSGANDIVESLVDDDWQQHLEG